MVTAVPGCECLRLLKCGAWLSRTKMGFLGDVLSNFFVYIMWGKKKSSETVIGLYSFFQYQDQTSESELKQLSQCLGDH